MAAAAYDIFCEQGADLRITLTWRDSAGDPVDVSGYTARMQVRQTVDADDFVVELTTENGYIEMGTTDGQILIYLPAAETAVITNGSYRYDMELVSPDATPIVRRFIEGKFRVKAEVTR